MPRATRTPTVDRAALLLLGFLVLIGCRRSETALPPGHAATEQGAGAISTASSATAPPKFSVPFHGVIKALERGDPLLGLGDTEITYTIADGRIRREAVLIGPLSKVPGSRKEVGGIICDLRAGQVVLYRRNERASSFARMTLAEYRKLIEGQHDVSDHVGTFFLGIPRPIPGGWAINQPDARTATGGILCDRLMIQLPDATYEIWHSQQIKVAPSLLGWVELGIPPEVSGFPCFMRCVPLLKAPAAHPGVSEGQKLMEKGTDWVIRAVEKVMKAQSELLQITEHMPADADFILDASFGELASLDELNRAFPPSAGRGGDWD
jgi:hypothetical protein